MTRRTRTGRRAVPRLFTFGTMGWFALGGSASAQGLPSAPVPELPRVASAIPADPEKKAVDEPEPKRLDNGTNGNEKKENGEAKAYEGQPYTLGECIAIALERQPTVKAARDSLRATQLGLQALNNLSGLAQRLSPDIPMRKQQAKRGIAVAEAETQKVHNEVVYDVTRLYWSYVYAKQQEQTAKDVIAQLEFYEDIIKQFLETGVRPPGSRLTQFTLYGLRDQILDVQRLRVTAVTGKKQALAALREAMGVDANCEFVPSASELPLMGGSVTREQVIELALSRRPELAQAAAGVDAFRLEICAQSKIRVRKSVPTLASGSDLHSRPVPMAVRNGEYKPGAVAPEMPPNLVGNQEDRVARATALAARADSVYEKARNLVNLEATNAFINWESTSEKLKIAKEKYDNGRKVAEETKKAAPAKQDPEMLVRNEALAGKSQAEYLEAVFEHLKALATLERVTAGGVCPAFPGR